MFVRFCISLNMTTNLNMLTKIHAFSNRNKNIKLNTF